MHDGEAEEVAGWTAVSVDDLLIAAERDLACAVSTASQECWTCLKPQEVSRDMQQPTRFLGIDLVWDAEGNLILSQESYVRGLGNRYKHELGDCVRPTIYTAQRREDLVEAHAHLRSYEHRICTRPDKAFTATYRSGLHTPAHFPGPPYVLQGSARNLERVQNESKSSWLCEGLWGCVICPRSQAINVARAITVKGSLVAWTVGRQPFLWPSPRVKRR